MSMTAVATTPTLNALVFGPDDAPVRRALRDIFNPTTPDISPDILAVILDTKDADSAAKSIRSAKELASTPIGPRAVIALAEHQPTSAFILSAVAAGADVVLPPGASKDQITIAAESAFAKAARDAATPETHRVAELQQRIQRLTQRIIQLEADAWSDPLTGLANRRQLSARMAQMFAEAVRYEGHLAAVLIDIDGFKQLNDTQGHRAGDDFLKAIARAITASIRSSDLAVRYGGDEFVVIMPRTPASSAKDATVRLRKALEPTFRAASQLGSAPCASLGLACLDITEPLEAEGLIDAADKAMYHAKQKGRGHVALALPEGNFEMLKVEGC